MLSFNSSICPAHMDCQISVHSDYHNACFLPHFLFFLLCLCIDINNHHAIETMFLFFCWCESEQSSIATCISMQPGHAGYIFLSAASLMLGANGMWQQLIFTESPKYHGNFLCTVHRYQIPVLPLPLS
jgi:hypothetical protein